MAWDTTIKGKNENKSDVQIAQILCTRFKIGDTKRSLMFSLGGLYEEDYITLISKSALEKIDRKAIFPERGIKRSRVSPESCGVTFEHIIPIAALYDYFDKNRKCLTDQMILDVIPLLKLAIITNDENEKLEAAKLQSEMPVGWWESENRDPLERYRKAKMGSIWNERFKRLTNFRANKVKQTIDKSDVHPVKIVRSANRKSILKSKKN